MRQPVQSRRTLSGAGLLEPGRSPPPASSLPGAPYLLRALVPRRAALVQDGLVDVPESLRARGRGHTQEPATLQALKLPALPRRPAGGATAARARSSRDCAGRTGAAGRVYRQVGRPGPGLPCWVEAPRRAGPHRELTRPRGLAAVPSGPAGAGALTKR